MPIYNYEVNEQVQRLLPLQTTIMVPLEFGWDHYSNVVLFLSSSQFLTLKPYYERILPKLGIERFDLDLDDEQGLLIVDISGQGGGDIHIQERRVEDPFDDIRGFIGSKLLNSLVELHIPAVFGFVRIHSN
jgi:hypothetical protein